MTNPDDPRTPQERAYDPRETDPSEGQGEQPTQQGEQPTQQFSTSDPTQAYGQAYAYPQQQYPTQQYPPSQEYQDATQAFAAYGQGYDQPPPNATQAFSPYGGPPYGPPPYDAPPQTPEEVPPPEDEKKGGFAKWVAVAAGALLLLAVILGGIALLGSGGDNSSTTAAPPTTTQQQAPETTPPPASDNEEPTDPENPGLEQVPGGIGEALGGIGATMGTVNSNEGGTLILDGIGGSTVTVETTPETRVIGLSGGTVADVKPGDRLIVQGSPVENGVMTADLIINSSIPGTGGN